MIKKLVTLLIARKAVVFYLVFGGLTTLVNVAVYYVCYYLLGVPNMPSTWAAWFAAVFFAYVTNRKWVFGSDETTARGIALEMGRFFACRVATGVVDWVCMFVFVDLLELNGLLIKTLANFLVIVLNYAASRLIIFRKAAPADGGAGKSPR